MAAEWRAGHLELFVSSKPGPKGPLKQPQVRDRVLVLRAQQQSVTKIAERLAVEGSPVSSHAMADGSEGAKVPRWRRQALCTDCEASRPRAGSQWSHLTEVKTHLCA